MAVEYEYLTDSSGRRDERFRRDTPVGETPICAYCGAATKMPAYTDMVTGQSFLACCSRPECIEKWQGDPPRSGASR